jgi:rfaE bifunctional protein nucleotidyltransferase chain/domain
MVSSGLRYYSCIGNRSTIRGNYEMPALRHPSEKICTLQEVVNLSTNVRAAGEKVILTSGCFDLVHAAHADYVYRAAQHGFLVLGINSDQFVQRLKGPNRPIRTENDRALLMAGLEPVGAVVIFDDDVELITAVRPQVYVASTTSHVTLDADPLRARALQAINAQVIELGSSDVGTSTTKLIERIRSTGT